MKIARQFRPERAISKDESRPELANVHLDVAGEAAWATDRHIVVRVPVEVEDGDVSGPVTADALAVSRKGSESIGCKPDELETEAANFKRPHPTAPFPDLKGIIPTDESIDWRVGVNVALLYRLAQSMGTEEVVLEFTGRDIADQAQPIRVTPLGRKSQGAIGLILPVRTGNVSYDGESTGADED